MVACSIGRQFFHGRRRPFTSPGKPRFDAWPKPTLSNRSHISLGEKPRAILAVPTFDDFWITCATVNAPCGWASEMVAGPIVILPGAQLMIVSKRTLPFSRARAAVNGFITEPVS